MSLRINNPEVERLIGEVAALTGETRAEVVRRALEERRARIVPFVRSQDRGVRLRHFLEHEVWPLVPDNEFGRRLTPDEEDVILGYGPEGV